MGISNTTHRWHALAKTTLLGAAFFLLSIVSTTYFSAYGGNVSLVWLPSGLALAVFLLGGQRYWPGIFVGAFLLGLQVGDSVALSGMLAAASVIDPWIGYLLLGSTRPFSAALQQPRDFVLLTAAGAVSAGASAILGIGILWLHGVLHAADIASTLLSWWQGNILGIVVVAPLVLVWRKWPGHWFQRQRIAETVTCFGLLALVGHLVFLDRFHDAIGIIAHGYWAFLFVSWAAVRFGAQGVTLAIAITAGQALHGAVAGTGPFANDLQQTHLLNTWTYLFALAAVGMALTLSIAVRKSAESRLTASERRLAEAQRLSRIGSWHVVFGTDGRQDIWTISQELHLLYAHDCNLPIDINTGFNTMPEEDRKATRQHWVAAKSGQGPFEWEHRVIVDGEIKWMRVLAQFEFDADGIALTASGTSQDITGHKLAELEQQLAALAFESQEGMIVTDPQQAIMRVNKAFTRITGYSPEDVVGKRPTLLKSERHDPAFYQSMWQSLQRHHFWQGEVWNRRKNGDVYPEWLSITEVLNTQGQVTNYVATFSDITQHKKDEETIHNLAFYDALTSLPNRRLMLDRLKQALLFSARKKTQGGLLFIDVDDFKSLNDTRGHAVGDLLLVEIARRIQNCIHVDDTVGRMGSDEFVVILSALSQEPDQAALQAQQIAERILRNLGQAVDLRGFEYHCQACIGIRLFCDDDATVEALLQHADAAMFQAKQSGRDKILFFDAGMHAALEARVQLESWLRKALPEQLQLYYQVQVDELGNVLGAEALARWLHPERGLIPPADFIPLAEETGLILPLGRWVLETACHQLKRWEADPATCNFQLSVNVSARQFRQADFVEQVAEVLRQTGAPPTRLKLELTESLLVDDIDAVIEKMRALKVLGIRFSLDDFGTGFSSLAYLKRLPLDQLKIDRSFVHDILDDHHDAAIVRTIIALGQSLGLSVIAEGVETAGQQGYLATLGCSEYQGYLFGQPVPLKEFEAAIVPATTLRH